MNITQNITDYINQNNISLSDFYIDTPPSCEVQARDIFGKILGVTRYSLLICSVMLCMLYFVFLFLGWYKKNKAKKLKEVEDLDGIIKLYNDINFLQDLILLVCFVLSSWLLQIVFWSL